MNLTEAKAIAGGLGHPSKLPGSSYDIPTAACITGRALQAIAGTVCHSCYATRDQMSWPNPRKAQAKRLAAIEHPRWADAMVAMLSHFHAEPYRRIDLGLRPGPKLTRLGSRYRMNETGWHRWHSSGDLQSVEHLAKICEVARRTPSIRHWLPTQELGMVRRYLREGGSIPENLIIRVSSAMIDSARQRPWPNTTSVFTETAPEGAHVCPAPQQNYQCGACRACWNRDVQHVAYRLH